MTICDECFGTFSLKMFGEFYDKGWKWRCDGCKKWREDRLNSLEKCERCGAQVKAKDMHYVYEYFVDDFNSIGLCDRCYDNK